MYIPATSLLLSSIPSPFLSSLPPSITTGVGLPWPSSLPSSPGGAECTNNSNSVQRYFSILAGNKDAQKFCKTKFGTATRWASAGSTLGVGGPTSVGSWGNGNDNGKSDNAGTNGNGDTYGGDGWKGNKVYPRNLSGKEALVKDALSRLTHARPTYAQDFCACNFPTSATTTIASQGLPTSIVPASTWGAGGSNSGSTGESQGGGQNGGSWRSSQNAPGLSSSVYSTWGASSVPGAPIPSFPSNVPTTGLPSSIPDVPSPALPSSSGPDLWNSSSIPTSPLIPSSGPATWGESTVPGLPTTRVPTSNIPGVPATTWVSSRISGVPSSPDFSSSGVPVTWGSSGIPSSARGPSFAWGPSSLIPSNSRGPSSRIPTNTQRSSTPIPCNTWVSLASSQWQSPSPYPAPTASSEHSWSFTTISYIPQTYPTSIITSGVLGLPKTTTRSATWAEDTAVPSELASDYTTYPTSAWGGDSVPTTGADAGW